MAHKILVVDDEPGTLKLVGSLLKSRNYEVLSAKDGLDALLMIQKEGPDLIVLDVMIPEINGYDICFQLRFNRSYEKIPIILLTKREQEIGEEIGHRSNIEYMPKPIDPKVLFAKLERLLQ